MTTCDKTAFPACGSQMKAVKGRLLNDGERLIYEPVTSDLKIEMTDDELTSFLCCLSSSKVRLDRGF